MIKNDFKSYDEKGRFNKESHNKMLLADLYNDCEKICQIHDHIVNQKMMSLPSSSADLHGTALIQAFYKFMPILAEIQKKIEDELDIKNID
mgnify:CR=1 FL=1